MLKKVRGPESSVSKKFGILQFSGSLDKLGVKCLDVLNLGVPKILEFSVLSLQDVLESGLLGVQNILKSSFLLFQDIQ